MKKNILNFWMVSSLSSVALMSDGTLPVFAQSDSKEDIAVSQKEPVFQEVVANLNEKDKISLKKAVSILDKADSYNVVALMRGPFIEFNADGQAPCIGGCAAGGCEACAPANPSDVMHANVKQIRVGEKIDKQKFEEALVLEGVKGKVVWIGRIAEVSDGLTLASLERVYPHVASLDNIAIVSWTVDSGVSDGAKRAFQQAGVNIEEVLNDRAGRSAFIRALS